MLAIESLDKLSSQIKLVGFDRSMERGAVAVYQDTIDKRQIYTAAKDAALDMNGVPNGIRQAPSGTMLSVLALTDERYEGIGSPDFQPI